MEGGKDTANAVEAFIARWSDAGGTERAKCGKQDAIGRFQPEADVHGESMRVSPNRWR